MYVGDELEQERSVQGTFVKRWKCGRFSAIIKLTQQPCSCRAEALLGRGLNCVDEDILEIADEFLDFDAVEMVT
jgi:hypothetical protein